MATKFLEPGGDADFAVNTATGFWGTIQGTAPTVATDFVHGGHKKSIKYATSSSYLSTPTGTAADAGGLVSFYIYLNTLPGATASIANIDNAALATVVRIRLTSGGVLQLWNATTQIGTNGATLSTGIWYRLSLAWTITDSLTNQFRVFKDGIQTISVSNASLTNINSSCFLFGNGSGDANLDMRSSDHYADDSSSLTDTGNIWVTAKRPNANGTTNGFTTQIGSGGSGYGSGHSSQVNERPLSNTNGWSMIGAGSAITEEYNIEGKATGDIDISSATIVDWLGWADMKSLVGETVQIILNGANNAQAITSTETLYTKIKGSTTYPAGTGADIGITTDTSLTTVSLYECGVIVAYIPGVSSTGFNIALV